jgi:hypothetical protein
MLGRFLELALLTEDPGSSWHVFRRLGFADATSGEVWTHPYGVVAAEGLALGLHAKGEEPNTLVFVRPDVAALERELSDRFMDVESVRLGSEVFNELALREPGGTLLRVIEARTFSPPAELPARTALGRFLAISLPCGDLGEARGFWERLGIDVDDVTQPWESLAIRGLPVACHQSASCREMVVLFDATTARSDADLRDAGLSIGRPLPALRHHGHRLVRGVEGLAMLLLDPFV